MKKYTINKTDLTDLHHLRNIRNDTVFTIVNRGYLWYFTLSDEQKVELKDWYFAWLDITETFIVPIVPTWLENECDYEIGDLYN